MQGLVTLDFGNTNPHAGLFLKQDQQWQLQSVVPFTRLQSELDTLKLSPHNSSMVLSQVKERDQDLQVFIDQGFLLTRVQNYWKGTRFAGMPVNYASTLGEDRLINAFYVFKKFKQPTLMIDAGTFTTIDVVTASGFEGGYIVPGWNVYQQSFAHGHQLKDLDLAMPSSLQLPSGTKEAMSRGYNAFVSLAHELINEKQITRVLLTGGNAALWQTLLSQKSLPAVVETHPHLVHFALQYWMTTQIEIL